MGVLSNGPRLPRIVPLSPGFSSPCGARSAHAHSPAPGLSFIAASFAHLNGVLITLPPWLRHVVTGPRQYTAEPGPRAPGVRALVPEPGARISSDAPATAHSLN